MKTKLTCKLIAALCAVVLLLGLTPAAFASDGPSMSSNSGRNNYSGYCASTVTSYLFANEKGGLTRVEGLEVEEYSSSFQLQSKHVLKKELPLIGGFFAGAQYNFMVFGQDNPSESDSTEVLRIVKYDKNWNRLDSASVYGANTHTPFKSGSLRCAEVNGILYIYTCHTMYKDRGGVNHQASMHVVVRESDMTVTEVDGNGEGFIGRVSHSFNQFVMVDSEGNLALAAHGDATPRSMALYLLMDRGGNAYPNTGMKEASPFTDPNDGDRLGFVITPDFPGATGQNETGATLGGLAETSNGYLLAFAQRASLSNQDPYQIKLAYVAKKDIAMRVAGTGGLIRSSFQIEQLTNGSDSMNNPFLVSTGLSGGYVIWTKARENDVLYYAAYDANGQTGPVQSASGRLSDCQPIVYNGKVVWYVTWDEYGGVDVPTFYTLDANGVTATKANSSSAPSTPAAPSTTETPTAPSKPSVPSGTVSFQDVPASFWAYDAIQDCASRGIVGGYSDGRFGPDDPLTTAQFIALVTRTFYGDKVAAVTAPAGEPWYYPNTSVATELGLDSGVRFDNFVMERAISRYDMAQILYNIILEAGKTLPRSDSRPIEAAASLPDWSSVPIDRQSAVRECVAQNIITGLSNGKFGGSYAMTRAQACVVIQRMMGLING